MAAVHGTPTRFEKAASKAIQEWFETHRDRETVSLYSLSTVADRAASEAGKKTELYSSLWDYMDILPATRTGWDYHGTAGGSEYSVRNPFYRDAGTVILHAAPEGEELDQVKVTPPKVSSPEQASSFAYQINNIRIKSTVALDRTMWLCVAPDGRKLESFFKISDARRWAETTHDFLSHVAMQREIAGAWRVLGMPKLENRNIVHEHGGWWVIGYNEEGDAVSYSVSEASGPNTYNGLSFEGTS